MTNFLEVYLPICIYILLIIMLIIGIILGIRLIGVMNKVDALINNIEDKVNSFNGLFNIINFANDKLTLITDKVGEAVSSLINRIGKKKYSDDMEDDDYE